jgi:hypothetical protein
MLSMTLPTTQQGDRIPLVLFGAFDRHNFGDLLFPHIAAALTPGRTIHYAGLLQRDMRPYGGHLVESVTHLAARLADSPVHLLHVGGELLTCGAWEAAVMLRPESKARAKPTSGSDDAESKRMWARAVLPMADLAPYTVARNVFPHARALAYIAVGGVELMSQGDALRKEVIGKLMQADSVTVRDTLTQAALHAAGRDACMLPDPAAMVAELFGATIMRHAQHGETAQVCAAYPNGYLALQFSAGFAEQATLEQLAEQVERVATK